MLRDKDDFEDSEFIDKIMCNKIYNLCSGAIHQFLFELEKSVLNVVLMEDGHAYPHLPSNLMTQNELDMNSILEISGLDMAIKSMKNDVNDVYPWLLRILIPHMSATQLATFMLHCKCGKALAVVYHQYIDYNSHVPSSEGITFQFHNDITWFGGWPTTSDMTMASVGHTSLLNFSEIADLNHKTTVVMRTKIISVNLMVDNEGIRLKLAVHKENDSFDKASYVQSAKIVQAIIKIIKFSRQAYTESRRRHLDFNFHVFRDRIFETMWRPDLSTVMSMYGEECAKDVAVFMYIVSSDKKEQKMNSALYDNIMKKNSKYVLASIVYEVCHSLFDPQFILDVIFLLQPLHIHEIYKILEF
jgi:hypothetical protein